MPSLVVHFLTSHAMSEVSRRAMQRHPFLCHRHWFHAYNMTYAFNVRGTSRLWGLWCHDCSILQSPSPPPSGSRRMRSFWSCDQLMCRRPLDLVWPGERGPWEETGPYWTSEAKCLKYRWTPSGSDEEQDGTGINSPIWIRLEVSVSCGQGARSWDTARGDSRDSRPAQWAHSWKNQHGSTWINMNQHESTMTNVALRLRSSSMPWLWGFNTVLLRSEHLWEPDPQQRICCELSGCRLPPGLWCKATLQWRTQICPILTARPFPASQVPQLQATARKAALLKSRYWSYRISNRYGAMSVWYTSIDWWLFSWSSLQAMPWPSW